MTRCARILCAIMGLTIGLLNAAAASAQGPQTYGQSIVQLMCKEDAGIEDVIREVERLRRDPIAGPQKAKMVQDWQTIENHYGKFTDHHLVEVASASDQLRRETWLVTGPEYVMRVQFIFYLGAADGPRLMQFRYDHDYWDLPWKAAEK